MALLTAIREVLLLVFEAVFGGGAAAVRYSRHHARRYFEIIAVTTAIVLVVPFLLILLKVFWGWVVPAYLAAFLGAFFVLVLGAFYVPLAAWIGAVLIAYHALTWSGTLSPLELGRRYVRKVLTALFIELLLGVYVILVPLDQGPGMFFVLLLLGSAIAVGSYLWGGFGSGRLFTWLAIAAVVIITLVLVAKAIHEATRPPETVEVCEPDYDRPLRQVLDLKGFRHGVRVKWPDSGGRAVKVPQYDVLRDDVDGDLVIDFNDGSRDTWSPDEPKRSDAWLRKFPIRMYGKGRATVVLYEKTCEEKTVAAKAKK